MTAYTTTEESKNWCPLLAPTKITDTSILARLRDDWLTEEGAKDWLAGGSGKFIAKALENLLP